MPQHVLDVKRADDVVQIPGEDRISGVRLRAHDRSQLIGLGPHRNPDELHAWHHGLAGREIAELEQLAEDVSGLAAKHAPFMAFLDDELKFLGRVVPLRVYLLTANPYQPQQPVSNRVQRDHERQDCLLQHVDHRGHVEHHPLRALERQRLRHHLADDDVQISQEGNGDHARDGMRRHPAAGPEYREPRLQLPGKPVLAIHSQSKARDRDADLSGGDVPVLKLRGFEDAQDSSCQPAPLRGLMLDGRARRANNGELRGHEQTVRHNEQHDDREGNDDLHQSLTSTGSAAPTRFANTDSTARFATRSTSNSYSPTTTFSPGAGRCPSAAVTSPPTVVASVSHVVLSRAAASSTAIPPGTRTRPSASVSATGSPALNSSPTLPSSSDRTSSSVSNPAVPPNSSTTSAWWDRRSRSTRRTRSAVTLSW